MVLKVKLKFEKMRQAKHKDKSKKYNLGGERNKILRYNSI